MQISKTRRIFAHSPVVSMTVRKEIPHHDGLYFITFTCCRWIPLIAEADAYYAVYKWFDYLKAQGHYIIAYVIMPNHLHLMLAFRNTQGKSINTIVGNGKRFIAYEIVKQLKAQNKTALLKKLQSIVDLKQRLRGKLHEIFEPSFAWKKCFYRKFTQQKLNYIHKNPCQKKWHLVERPEQYIHSSANYYATGVQGAYEVLSYAALGDIDLSKPIDA
jgi:REP element-mobilizing transposase RayT